MVRPSDTAQHKRYVLFRFSWRIFARVAPPSKKTPNQNSRPVPRWVPGNASAWRAQRVNRMSNISQSRSLCVCARVHVHVCVHARCTGLLRVLILLQVAVRPGQDPWTAGLAVDLLCFQLLSRAAGCGPVSSNLPATFPP